MTATIPTTDLRYVAAALDFVAPSPGQIQAMNRLRAKAFQPPAPTPAEIVADNKRARQRKQQCDPLAEAIGRYVAPSVDSFIKGYKSGRG